MTEVGLTSVSLFLLVVACSGGTNNKNKEDSGHKDGGSSGSTSTGAVGGDASSGAGGSDAAGTGGTGGSEAGGTGGSGGSGGSSSAACPYTLPAGAIVCECPEIASRMNCTATAGQPILDDGEWANGTDWNGAPRGDFAGWWGHWMPSYDEVTAGSTCFEKWEGWFPGNPELPMENPFDSSSIAAMAIRGAGCNNADFFIDGLPDPGCANVSAFQGFTVDIMANKEMEGLIFVAQQDNQSHDAHTMPITYTTAWQRIDVKFCMLTSPETFNAANISAVGFRASGDFDVYVDNVIFYE
jgi:hypothetical protein